MQDCRQPYTVQNWVLTFKTFSNNLLWIEWLGRLEGSYARSASKVNLLDWFVIWGCTIKSQWLVHCFKIWHWKTSGSMTPAVAGLCSGNWFQELARVQKSRGSDQRGRVKNSANALPTYSLTTREAGLLNCSDCVQHHPMHPVLISERWAQSRWQESFKVKL